MLTVVFVSTGAVVGLEYSGADCCLCVYRCCGWPGVQWC